MPGRFHGHQALVVPSAAAEDVLCAFSGYVCMRKFML